MRPHSLLPCLALALALVPRPNLPADTPPVEIAGIYPHLTMFNNESECGTGAVVPWAGRLWVITYGPHLPMGSSDKLYEITPDLQQIIRPESVGGTPANRMIHRESAQLNIGPYFIRADGSVRVIPPAKMPGRHTGTARHLTDPANKLYIATMEEGLYEVDVHTLEVVEIIKDGNRQPAVGEGLTSKLPGYHGKGLFTAQGRLVYANNGEHGKDAQARPDIPSGSLATWTGSGDWQLVRRNQFTEVSGPGGIEGNASPADPLWSLGWDQRSLILMLLDGGKWHPFRLPKGSHSYDGAHGWNTEWPRIRDIGEATLLATMHGTFWHFPKTFSAAKSAGIAPRSNYLKVIGDFARWNDRLVIGCDDSAQKEFLNHRPFKAAKGTPLRSNSNLWFIKPELLDQLGPVIGRGSVWLKENVAAGATSEPYLFAGYDHRMLAITHQNPAPLDITLEIDRSGDGAWTKLETFTVDRSLVHIFPASTKGAWIRAICGGDAKQLSVHFHYRNRDPRPAANDPLFAPLAQAGSTPATTGLIRSIDQVLAFAEGETYAELDATLTWTTRDDPKALAAMRESAQPKTGFTTDAASVIVTEDGATWRLPKNDSYIGFHGRICREVATERDLFNLHGTFYELPARNAQGMAKIRPIATHNLAISDYGSHFGLLFLTGLTETTADHPRVIRSTDGAAAVWAGVIDDLWKLGKPRGEGGPWKNYAAKAGVPSDPYLMTGFDRKSVTLEADTACRITLEIDIDGTGVWLPWKHFDLTPGTSQNHIFPEGFSAYWVRARADHDCTATAWFKYE